jgi:hypothetical protein
MARARLYGGPDRTRANSARNPFTARDLARLLSLVSISAEDRMTWTLAGKG